VVEGERVHGSARADDGYAAFASIAVLASAAALIQSPAIRMAGATPSASLQVH